MQEEHVILTSTIIISYVDINMHYAAIRNDMYNQQMPE